jgi:hypothetical protein
VGIVVLTEDVWDNQGMIVEHLAKAESPFAFLARFS